MLFRENAVKTVEAHRGAVNGVAVRCRDSRVLATWSYTPGVSFGHVLFGFCFVFL